jgi:polyhydroxyalkanoate synthesis regulator protein
MQMVVPKYLEQSIDTLTREQEKFRKQLTNTFSGTPFAPLEEHVRRNMELFQADLLDVQAVRAAARRQRRRARESAGDDGR